MRPKSPARLSSRRWATTGVSFLVAGTALLMATPAAYANTTANIEGARATFESSNGGVFRLYDTQCDSDPVFLDYTFQGHRHRLDYSGGCGTHATYNLHLPPGKKITYKACVNRDARPDKCSGQTDDLT
jgi:hypothetical protein